MSAYTLVTDQNLLPQQIQDLLKHRSIARDAKDFSHSDSIREEIKDLGYLVNDKDGEVEILKIGDSDITPAKSFLLLFGSGEIAPSSVDIYRQTFLKLAKRNLKISLITTPAGFQPNVEHVYGEIKDFLLTSLPDFNLTINIIYANTKDEANDETIVNQLDGSDVIFTGPGSPTYAIKHLRSTLLLRKIIDLVKNGSTLILASAATITFSRFALPVYEIFKVGEDLHWVDGLNIFKDIWQEATIIPHLNNAEGGKDLDTTNCYIGEDRAKKLYDLLPDNTQVIGIDEHTCMVIDLSSRESTIYGKGKVTRIK